MLQFEEIVRKVQISRPGDDLGLLRKAYEFSASEHKAQTRISGEPFVSHPLAVANVLADMKLDVVCLVAGMLHDVVEDTPTTIDRIGQEFGPDVARIAEDVKKAVESRRKVSEEFLEEVRALVDAKLREHSIPARIDGRIKRLFSIWQKLKKQHINIDQVYDLLAIRILTDSVKNCYAALGVIHNTWRPVPGRIKDFIAIPRPNLYQSLHTSVIGPHGQPFEVQIRTEEMHRVAEEGIAAHWKYKDGRKGPAIDDQRIAWLRHLVEWQQDMQDPGEFMSTLKVDLYPEEVYTFTPRGRVIVLPRDATPIDFAYAIHSDVGNTCVGAKVNGRIVPLRSSLRNGDIVEIMTQPGHEPSKDWLAFVKTPRARNKIRHLVNASERVKAIEIGEKYLEKEARRLGVQLSKISPADLEKVAGGFGGGRVEGLYSPARPREGSARPAPAA